MRVMHLIDSLSAGGAERVAVNMVNTLNQAGVETWLCATRSEGPLKTFIENPDRYLFLGRKKKIDMKALRLLVRFIKHNQITILHAHSSSFFTAVIVKIVTRSVKVVWHDHYGLSDQLSSRKSFSIKVFSIFFDAVFSVNHTLKEWAVKNLFVRADRINFLANYANLGKAYQPSWKPDRLTSHIILCLANLRPQKDHGTLLQAFRMTKQQYPDATLYMVGKDLDDVYSKMLKEQVKECNLTDVFFMGEQTNVTRFLDMASVGVLSSLSEGLPIALLEYGLAGLPVICTNVGECKHVLDGGKAGWLIQPGDAEAMMVAIKEAFENEEKTSDHAYRLHQQIQLQYSEESAQHQLIAQYNAIG
ncbi:MAG TPA: glycosyltransferase [Cyclobacteriaceae bacterium]|nr:glycosyltransferase [Cyclobacteriaceae bacterium]